MIQCPKCKVSIDDDSWYCDQCGEQILYCPKCGEPRKGKRCTQCGSVLISAEDYASRNDMSPTPTLVNHSSGTSQVAPQPSQPQPSQGSTIRNVPDSSPTRLVMVDDPSKVVILKDNAIIGRTTGDYLNVFGSCGYVSGRHGRIARNTSMKWTYADLGSTNGSVIDGKNLLPNTDYVLDRGQIIEIGYLKFRVE